MSSNIKIFAEFSPTVALRLTEKRSRVHTDGTVYWTRQTRPCYLVTTILCWCCQVTLISASGRLVKLLHKPVSQSSFPRNQTKVEGEPTLPSEFLRLCLLSLFLPPDPPSKNKINFLGHFSSKQLARSAFSLKMPCLVQWLC